MCHRSGFLISRGFGKRHLKSQGSKKINGFCPARIQVTINKYCDSHKVSFVETHVGHQNDLCHLFLTNDERKVLATKISMNIPFDEILNEIRDTVSTNSMERMHLLTKKDLFNIEACFNLDSTSQRHKNDDINVDAWVEEMKSSCVLFYKPQGTILEDYPQFRQEDFILIIMTEDQKMMLLNYAQNYICIDGIHGLNNNNFKLYTLLVLDELHQGFPCSFLVSNRSDEVVMNTYFNCIKAEVGNIETKVFMSDMGESYYNAWIQIMSEAQFRLFCSWHVDSEWRKNLHNIKLKENQATIYKMLRTLMQESDTVTFEKMINEFVVQLFEKSETVEFAKYFQNYYVQNCKSWAYCYWIHSGLNTNMHLERLHKSIKHIYLRGKKVQHLDKTLGVLMKLVRDLLFDRLLSLNEGKISSKLKELQKRHESSIVLNTNSICEKNEGIWLIQSTSGSSSVYTISENNTSCECQLSCSQCKTCIHKYSCDCIDCAIRWNMCKHIHLLCRYLKEQKNTNEAPCLEYCSDDSENFDTMESQTFKETEQKINQISSNITHIVGNNDLCNKKKKLLEKISREILSIENINQFKAIEKIVASIGPTLKALQCTAVQKNIIQQRRLPKKASKKSLPKIY